MPPEAEVVLESGIRVLVPIAVVLNIAAVSTARATEIEVESESIGQAYQLRWLRLGAPDETLNRRRFSQSLRLSAWDILAPARIPGRPPRSEEAPFPLRLEILLRVDHDFGSFAQDRIAYPSGATTATARAHEVVPELEEQRYALDLIVAQVEGSGAMGWLDFRLGRQLAVDAVSWYAFDGAWVRAHAPGPVSLELHAGFELRGEVDAAAALSTFEPDGTGSGECRVYDDVRGRWEPSPRCPQRDAVLPTLGVAIVTDDTGPVDARIGYRRTVSTGIDDAHPADPGWDVNHESLTAEAWLAGAPGQAWAAARYSLLLGAVDEARVGGRLLLGRHGLSGELVHSLPSFDGDSLFNVFAGEAYDEARLAWDLAPRRSRLRPHARGRVRAFHPGENPTDEDLALSAGLDAGLRFAGDVLRWRLDAGAEDGYGGRRIGADATVDTSLGRRFDLSGRATVIHHRDARLADWDDDHQGVMAGFDAGGRWRMSHGVYLHLILEENISYSRGAETRAVAILDLTFRPEL